MIYSLAECKSLLNLLCVLFLAKFGQCKSSKIRMIGANLSLKIEEIALVKC